jgi:ribose/xylose/arabinose/galactoside ABC-type transport system permease subunit
MNAQKEQVRSSQRFVNFLVKYWLGLFTVAIFLFFSVIQPRFASVTNIMAMLSSTCILALVGMGVTFVMSVGEIDFSCGMELAVAAVIIAKILDKPAFSGLYVPVVLFAILVVAGYGLINVFLHIKIKMPSFIATMGTSLIATGICKWMTKGGSISSRRWPDSYTFLGQAYIFNVIPVSVAVTVVIIAVMWIYSERTKSGQLFYAVGSSATTCKYVGVNVASQKIKAFVICALLCALAGIFQTSMLNSASPYMGSDALINALTVLMLGATFIKTGVYNIPGTIVAAFMLRVISFGMTMMGAPSFAFDLVQGGLLLLSISLVTLIHAHHSKSIG